MKFSAQEEYALRCLISIGRFYGIKEGLTIPDISKREGISQHTVAKTLRQLRIGGFLDSERGHTGGYALTRTPEEIKIGDVLHSLGGKLYDDEFCQTHSGANGICSNSTDCSIRSLWRVIQDAVDSVTTGLTLKDLLGTEDDVFARFSFDSENTAKS